MSVRWKKNVFDDGAHATVGRYFLHTYPRSERRWGWSVQFGTKVVSSDDAEHGTGRFTQRGATSEASARIGAELGMTIHRTTRKQRSK